MTVAAFEVPLSSQPEREAFLSVLRKVAEAEGMHVDAVSDRDLDRQGEIIPTFNMTMNAAVWRGAKDDEPIATAMDGPDHLGQVWVCFFKGQDPTLNTRLRESALREIMRKWPGTLSLPIMPTGALPLHSDLVRVPEGYVVNPVEAHKYELQARAGRPR